MKPHVWVLLAGTVILCVGLVVAQDSCPEIVRRALDVSEDLCQAAERNQACYGNIAVTAEAQPRVQNFKFDRTGDIVDVASINRLVLEAMNESAGTWGLVIMRLQADLPDTMPGQNVTFVLFGDVELENAAQPGDTPMHAFYLRSGIGDAPCAEAPQSGLIIQTPQGVGEISFNMNGVDVQMGSTVFFQYRNGQSLIVRTLEGSAMLEIDGILYPVLQGTELEAAVDEDGNINLDEVYLDVYTEDDWRWLPLDLLERDIEPVELTEEEFNQVFDAIENGGELCSDDAGSFLPACEDLPGELGGAACVYRPSRHAPLCDEANPCNLVAAEMAADCEAALQEAIASGVFEDGSFEFDTGNPCAFVPTEFAVDCDAAYQEMLNDMGITATDDFDDSGSGSQEGDAGGETGDESGDNSGEDGDAGADNGEDTADDDSRGDDTGGDGGGDAD